MNQADIDALVAALERVRELATLVGLESKAAAQYFHNDALDPRTGYLAALEAVKALAEEVAALKRRAAEQTERIMRMRGENCTPEVHTENVALRRQAAALAGRERRLRDGLQEARDWLEELRVTWERGVFHEHDGKGGMRSNRNAELEVKLRALLAEAQGETA